MTISERFFVENYDVEIAQQLIGPANLGSAQPAGFTDHLALIVKTIAVFILRVFNYLCGDHQWYNNHTARQIILEHIVAGSQSNSTLSQRVLQLYQDLGLRANGHTSWTEGIHRSSLLYREQPPALPLVEDSPPISPMTLHQLPPEMCLKVFKELDAQSLLSLLCTSVQTYHFIKSDPHLIRDILLGDAQSLLGLLCANDQPYHFIKNDHQFVREILLEVAMNKMLNIVEGMEDTNSDSEKLNYLVEVVIAQALTHPERALEIANRIQNPAAKQEALAEVAKSYAITNPELAIATLDMAVMDDLTRDHDLTEIAKKQAAADPRQALATANLILDAYCKSQALLAIANKQTTNAPDQAEDLFQQALESAKMIADNNAKIIALLRIVKAWRLTNSEQANAMFDEVRALASTHVIFHYLHRTEAYQALALVNPEQAREGACLIQDSTRRDKILCMVSKIQAAVNPIEARATANLICSNYLKAEALCILSKALATVDCEQANEVLREASDLIQDNDESRAAVLCWITGAQAIVDPDQLPDLEHLVHDRLSNTIHLTEVSRQADLVLSRISETQALSNPEQALRTANLIRNTAIKSSAFGRIAKIQARTNQVKANDIFFQAIMLTNQEEQIGCQIREENVDILGEIIEDMVAARCV